MSGREGDLFERAREADLVAVAGVPVFRGGQRLRGPCPVCKAGMKSKKRGDGAFWIDPRIGRWGCFAGAPECARGGDVIALEQLLHGGTMKEAAERLAGPDAPRRGVRETPPAVRVTRSAGDAPTAGEQRAAELWRGAMPAAGTLAEVYLRARGIRGPVLAEALKALRFHPRAFWGGEPGAWIHAPAMLARVVTPAGPTGGVHATYLAADGSGKAALKPAKRMFGPQTGLDGAVGGAWLIGPKGRGGVIVGEGIESVLSALMLRGGVDVTRMERAVATLSLDRLQGGWRRDAWDRIDPACVAGDPERPAFTWPLAGLGVGEVLIAVDRDMGPVTVKARKATGGTRQAVLDSDARARICAGLAAQAWRRANPDMEVWRFRAIAPGPGRDFNDELMGRMA